MARRRYLARFPRNSALPTRSALTVDVPAEGTVERLAFICTTLLVRPETSKTDAIVDDFFDEDAKTRLVLDLDKHGIPDFKLDRLDSYSHGNVMWGDAGKLFWWISAADLKAARFGRARFEMQF